MFHMVHDHVPLSYQMFPSRKSYLLMSLSMRCNALSLVVICNTWAKIQKRALDIFLKFCLSIFLIIYSTKQISTLTFWNAKLYILYRIAVDWALRHKARYLINTNNKKQSSDNILKITYFSLSVDFCGVVVDMLALLKKFIRILGISI